MEIKRREIAVSIILSIVTCGIYGIVWIISMVKEAVSVKNPGGDATTEIVLSILLPCVGLYMAEQKFAEGCKMRGIPHQDNSTLYLILGLVGFGIVAVAMMQNDLNKLVDSGYPGAYPPPNPYNPYNPYGGQPNPYGGQPNPYGGQPNPYGGQPNPYGGQPNPYGGQPNPYGGQPNPYGGQPNPYDPYGNQPPQG